VARDAAAWLASAPEATLHAPSELSWRAAQPYRESRGEYPFLPRALQRDEPPLLLVFVDDEAGRFVYVGEGHLGSWGYSDEAPDGEVAVTLREKLPKQLWLELGGYDGWAVSGRNVRRTGLSSVDAEALVEQLFDEAQPEIWIERYEGDGLLVAVSEPRAFVMYLREPGDAGFHATDPSLADSPEYMEWELENGQVDEFPYGDTVPVSDALDAARHHLRVGGRLPTLTWVED
jgi:hypothetical protein